MRKLLRDGTLNSLGVPINVRIRYSTIHGQGVSIDLPALIDSEIRLPDESMKDFLDYFGARKYETNKGYSVEWVAKKIRWSTHEEAIGILKVWAYSSRAEECTEEKLKELNRMTDDQVLSALKTLEEPSVLRKMGDKQLNIRVKLTTTDTHKTFCKQALVDSGSTSSCISWKFIKENNLDTIQLPFPITCYNADGTTNKSGSVTEVVRMNMIIGDHQELIQLSVTNLSNHDLFLGYDWLQKHNPSIDWKDSSISLQNCRQWCRKVYVPKEPEEIEDEDIEEEAIEEGEKVLFINLEEEAWRREELNIRSRSESVEESKEKIPKEYQDFNDQVFNKAVFEKLPDQSKWDHTIKLIPNTTLKDCKIYPLNIKEQEELDNFLEEHLKSGRIRPSKSPCAVSFFFVKKKDGSLRPVQDYRRLNEATIKNKYPLPLIQELINKV